MNQGKAGKILIGRSINASDFSSKKIINARSHVDIFIWDQFFMANFFECILKADSGGMFFSLRLSCATSIRHDFRPSTRPHFSFTTSSCVVTYAIVAHDSRKQKLYRLTRTWRIQSKQKTNHVNALTIIFHNWLTSSVTSHHIYVQ